MPNRSGQDQLLVLDVNDAWGLNIVSSQYNTQVGKINSSLQILMDQLSESVKEGANALYQAGAAVLYAGICEAFADFSGGATSLYAGREPGAFEKEHQAEQQALQTREKSINEALKEDRTFTAEEKNKLFNKKDLTGGKLLPSERQQLEREKEEIKSKREKFNNKLNSLYTKANSKMQALQLLTKGIGEIPQKTFESLQQKLNADKSNYDAVERQSSSAYDAVRQLLRALIDIDYFAGLITLGSIQLR